MKETTTEIIEGFKQRRDLTIEQRLLLGIIEQIEDLKNLFVDWKKALDTTKRK